VRRVAGQRGELPLIIDASEYSALSQDTLVHHDRIPSLKVDGAVLRSSRPVQTNYTSKSSRSDTSSPSSIDRDAHVFA
jgi:hypothetical protein